MTLTDEWASEPLTGIVHDEVPVSMDPKVRDLLVAGLLSGRYSQGYDRLRSVDELYTPLGVLCDIAVKLGVCAWDRVDDEWFIAPLNPPATGAFLPPIVREWAKIKGTHPSQELPLRVEGDLHPIWRLSDIFKMPFVDIAGLLKDQYQ